MSSKWPASRSRIRPLVSDDLLQAPESGLMGLGWQALASSGAKPFWQALYESKVFDEPVMAFYLTRFKNVFRAQEQEPGGVFTLASTNTSLYTDQIDYQSIPSGSVSYWTLPITKLSVNSNSITSPSGESSYAAIDMGTTLIGGPASQLASLYASIPNSAAGTGNYDGYYLYPCSTTINVAISFCGQSISPDNFKLAQISSGQCVRAIFVFTEPGSGPRWIAGNAFLKNVYLVFQENAASVGFATLVPSAQNLATRNAVPKASVSVTDSGHKRIVVLPCVAPYLVFAYL